MRKTLYAQGNGWGKIGHGGQDKGSRPSRRIGSVKSGVLGVSSNFPNSRCQDTERRPLVIAYSTGMKNLPHKSI